MKCLLILTVKLDPWQVPSFLFSPEFLKKLLAGLNKRFEENLKIKICRLRRKIN